MGGKPETNVFPVELCGDHGGDYTFLADSFLVSVATGQYPIADVIVRLHRVALVISATCSTGK